MAKVSLGIGLWALGGVLVGLTTPVGAQSREPKPLSGYIRDIPAEAESERATRHREVAARRAQPTLIIVHRGAGAFAPENTLEAYAAAMDYGADGCEIDLRRTVDGVLVLFHDDMLDQLTDGFGEVSHLTYYELLTLHPQFLYGTATPRTRPPTFAAVLTLARQRRMLLHLDIKEPHLEDEITRLLDAAEAWDHVVSVNTAQAPRFRDHPKIKPLPYKGPAYENREDMSQEAVRAVFARPGQMVMVDDPRVAANLLGRPPYRPVPLSPHLRQDWPPKRSEASNRDTLIPMRYLRPRTERLVPDSAAEMMALLSPALDNDERTRPDGDEFTRRRRTERLLDRAWAAQRLGQIGRPTPELIRLLEYQVTHRTLHPDWRYHGLDGAMAARALGRLGAAEAVPTLIEAFLRIDPELKRVADPQFRSNPLAWTDFRAKMTILPALGDLRCEASKRFLLRYLNMTAQEARELAPPLFAGAAKALLKHPLTEAELTALLQNPRQEVRGTVLQECLDHPSKARLAAVKTVFPWALALPRAER